MPCSLCSSLDAAPSAIPGVTLCPRCSKAMGGPPASTPTPSPSANRRPAPTSVDASGMSGPEHLAAVLSALSGG